MSLALLSMQIRDVWFALEAGSVVEILGEQRWAPLPDAPPHMPGVLPWRGRAIAMLDLGALTGALAPLRPGERRPRTLVLKEGGCTLALPVDAVRAIAEVPPEALRPAHLTTERYSRGEVELQGAVMPLLDLAAIVAAVAQDG